MDSLCTIIQRLNFHSSAVQIFARKIYRHSREDARRGGNHCSGARLAARHFILASLWRGPLSCALQLTGERNQRSQLKSRVHFEVAFAPSSSRRPRTSRDCDLGTVCSSKYVAWRRPPWASVCAKGSLQGRCAHPPDDMPDLRGGATLTVRMVMLAPMSSPYASVRGTSLGSQVNTFLFNSFSTKLYSAPLGASGNDFASELLLAGLRVVFHNQSDIIPRSR